jgi:hypothetical protein
MTVPTTDGDAMGATQTAVAAMAPAGYSGS